MGCNRRRELATLAGNDGLGSSVAISPDGKTVITRGENGTPTLWDVSSGRELHALILSWLSAAFLRIVRKW